MHKCPKCGTEFEGNFCPECGEKWLEEKTCPACGAVLPGSAKFCNQCGHSFVEAATPAPAPAQAVSPVPARKEAGKTAATLYGVSRYLPMALLALLSVLLFLFCLAPAAVMQGGDFMGEKIPSESLGSVYQMLSAAEPMQDGFGGSELTVSLPSLRGSSASLIAFAALMLASAAGSACCYVLRRRRLYAAFCGAGYAFLFAAFISSCAMIGIVGQEDGGLGMLAAGAAPILVLVFSLLFGLLAAAAAGMCLYSSKIRPEIRERHRETVRQKADTYAAAHPLPAAPATKIEKPVSPARLAASYGDIVPEEQRAEIMPGMQSYLRQKRKCILVAVLLAVLTVLVSAVYYFIGYCVAVQQCDYEIEEYKWQLQLFGKIGTYNYSLRIAESLLNGYNLTLTFSILFAIALVAVIVLLIVNRGYTLKRWAPSGVYRRWDLNLVSLVPCLFLPVILEAISISNCFTAPYEFVESLEMYNMMAILPGMFLISVITIAVQNKKLANRRKPLCLKLCGGKHPKDNPELLKQREQSISALPAQKEQYKTLRAEYKVNARAWNAYRFQKLKYDLHTKISD